MLTFGASELKILDMHGQSIKEPSEAQGNRRQRRSAIIFIVGLTSNDCLSGIGHIG